MKRWQRIVIAAASILVAIAIAVFVDTGFVNDTMDCGSGMNGYGYCNNSQGSGLLYLLKVCGVMFLFALGGGLIFTPPPPVESSKVVS